MLAVLALVACEQGDAPIEQAGVSGRPAVPTLVVEVAARVGEPGRAAAWTARAAWGEDAPERAPSPGECRRGRDLSMGAGGKPGAEAIGIEGPTLAALSWDRPTGTWSAAGPRQSLDPAWSVSDVTWRDADGEHRAEDMVRFGGVPAITRVTREREGDVTLGWDPGTVEQPSIEVVGPGGMVECGVRGDEATLPWWAVPAYGGEVVLRSVREESQIVDGVLVRVRTILEREVPLDRPAGTTAGEEPPSFEPYSPNGRRRTVRRVRSTVG